MYRTWCFARSESNEMDTIERIGNLIDGLEEGTSAPLSLDHFDRLGEIGRGAFGIVFRMRHRQSDEVVAIKQLYLGSRSCARQAIPEIQVLAQFRHPNLCSLYGAFLERDEECVQLVLEYCQRGDLEQHATSRLASIPLSDDDVLTLLGHVASGLAYLHAHRVMHRDIKPSNILLCEDGSAKVTDFGTARVLESADRAQTMAGTPLYMAPEMVLRKPYDFSADVWSLGATFYKIVTGRPPYPKGYTPDSTAPAPLSSTTYPKAAPLIMSMLSVDPTARPSLAALLQNHNIAEALLNFEERVDMQGGAGDAYQTGPCGGGEGAGVDPAGGISPPPALSGVPSVKGEGGRKGGVLADRLSRGGSGVGRGFIGGLSAKPPASPPRVSVAAIGSGVGGGGAPATSSVGCTPKGVVLPMSGTTRATAAASSAIPTPPLSSVRLGARSSGGDALTASAASKVPSGEGVSGSGMLGPPARPNLHPSSLLVGSLAASPYAPPEGLGGTASHSHPAPIASFSLCGTGSAAGGGSGVVSSDAQHLGGTAGGGLRSSYLGASWAASLVVSGHGGYGVNASACGAASSRRAPVRSDGGGVERQGTAKSHCEGGVGGMLSPLSPPTSSKSAQPGAGRVGVQPAKPTPAASSAALTSRTGTGKGSTSCAPPAHLLRLISGESSKTSSGFGGSAPLSATGVGVVAECGAASTAFRGTITATAGAADGGDRARVPHTQGDAGGVQLQETACGVAVAEEGCSFSLRSSALHGGAAQRRREDVEDHGVSLAAPPSFSPPSAAFSPFSVGTMGHQSPSSPPPLGALGGNGVRAMAVDDEVATPHRDTDAVHDAIHSSRGEGARTPVCGSGSPQPQEMQVGGHEKEGERTKRGRSPWGKLLSLRSRSGGRLVRRASRCTSPTTTSAPSSPASSSPTRPTPTPSHPRASPPHAASPPPHAAPSPSSIRAARSPSPSPVPVSAPLSVRWPSRGPGKRVLERPQTPDSGSLICPLRADSRRGGDGERSTKASRVSVGVGLQGGTDLCSGGGVASPTLADGGDGAAAPADQHACASPVHVGHVEEQKGFGSAPLHSGREEVKVLRVRSPSGTRQRLSAKGCGGERGVWPSSGARKDLNSTLVDMLEYVRGDDDEW